MYFMQIYVLKKSSHAKSSVTTAFTSDFTQEISLSEINVLL